ncbi:HpcH/HpaI aldolase family protein [Streptomyces tendae]
MTPIRLNGAIAALAAGRPVYSTFVTGEPNALLHKLRTPYDVVVFDTEHQPLDLPAVREGLLHLLDRREILEGGTLAPSVTPFVRLAANGGEHNQYLAKQALDLGAYGLVWPHVSTVDEAWNAVSASRYPRPSGTERHDPPGVRGFGPARAARYWGLDVAAYRERADVWPLAPEGEIAVVVMCEERRAIDNLPGILERVPGIAAVLIGTGDLALDLGHLDTGHPDVVAATDEVLAVCRASGVACGVPGVTRANVGHYLERGFRWLLTGYFGADDAVAAGRALDGGPGAPA